jgi:hypothetical protein
MHSIARLLDTVIRYLFVRYAGPKCRPALTAVSEGTVRVSAVAIELELFRTTISAEMLRHRRVAVCQSFLCASLTKQSILPRCRKASHFSSLLPFFNSWRSSRHSACLTACSLVFLFQNAQACVCRTELRRIWPGIEHYFWFRTNYSFR